MSQKVKWYKKSYFGRLTPMQLTAESAKLIEDSKIFKNRRWVREGWINFRKFIWQVIKIMLGFGDVLYNRITGISGQNFWSHMQKKSDGASGENSSRFLVKRYRPSFPYYYSESFFSVYPSIKIRFEFHILGKHLFFSSQNSN